jgi:hypothetical protein
MPDLFTLDTTGFLFTEIAGEWNVMSADFGDGFEAAATVGSAEGTRQWTMRVDVLPGTDAAPAIADELEPFYLLTEGGDYVLTEGGDRILLEHESTRAEYLWRAFRVSKANGNRPFWIEIEDPDNNTRKLYLASFADNKLSYAVLCARIYSTGLVLRQRRLRDVESPVPVT